MKETRDRVLKETTDKELASKIISYRGGYLAEERRNIERDMFSGASMIVISTSALEVGVDLSHIDCVLMHGIPRDVTSFHQQAGRAGRSGRTSLVLVVANGSSLDQHRVREPGGLLDAEYTTDPVHWEDPLILGEQLQCAAYESLVDPRRDKAWWPGVPGGLEEMSKLYLRPLGPDTYTWNALYDPYPAERVQIRNGRGVGEGGEEVWTVVDVGPGRGLKILEEVEACRGIYSLYPGAVWHYQGHTYIVEEVGGEKGWVGVRMARVDYLTDPRDYTDVDPEDRMVTVELDSPSDQGVSASYGRVCGKEERRRRGRRGERVGGMIHKLIYSFA